jgi:hypothetical protein
MGSGGLPKWAVVGVVGREMEDWRLEIGDWRLEIGDWRLKTGDRRPETGDRRPETGDRRPSGKSRLGNRVWDIASEKSRHRVWGIASGEPCLEYHVLATQATQATQAALSLVWEIALPF